jgi:hypothetical protein
MSISWRATLASTPSEPAVPAHQAQGSVSVSSGAGAALSFAADGHTRAPVSLPLAQIAKRQLAKGSADGSGARSGGVLGE